MQSVVKLSIVMQSGVPYKASLYTSLIILARVKNSSLLKWRKNNTFLPWQQVPML